MATVYLAQDLRHRRRVAVKVLRPDLAAAMGAERFLREIGIAAALQHPHILPLYDSGQAGEFLFYVMPFVEGASLRERVAREGALPVSDATRILRDVADALAEAHRHGVVHRDIKPENVMLSGRHALVADFGVAKAVSEASAGRSLTATGVAIGTPAYMAPEQATADPSLDHRADIYAVGALAYELLAGRPPFQHATMQGLIAAHVTTPPERLSVHRPSVPPALEALVMHCLEKRAADRPQTADAIVSQLEALPVSGATTPVPATVAASAPATGNRTRGIIAAAVVAAAIAVGWFATRPAPVSVADLDPDLVLALPFRVTATSPEILNLREGVVDILQASLGGNVGPRVVAAQTAIVAWRRAGGGDGADLDDARARALARELGAAHFLTGSIVQQGLSFVLSGTLTPAAGGASVQGRVEGPTDSTLALVGRLVNQLLSLQAGEEAGRASSLADLPMPALQAYLEGQRAWRAGRWPEAYDGFGRAIAADSTFALAGLYHNMAAGWNIGGPPSSGLTVARANLDRLSERDRVLAGMILNLVGDSTHMRVIARREQAAAILSDRAEAWYLLGDHIYHYGQLAGMSEAEQQARAWAAFDRGLALDPGFGPILTHAVDRHLFPNTDSAAYAAAAQQHPAIAAEDHVAMVAALTFRDTARLRDMEPRLSSAQLYVGAMLTALVGDGGIAIPFLKTRALRATSAGERQSSFEVGRMLAWGSGRPALAARMSQELGVAPSGTGWQEHAQVILAALLYDGEPAAAREAARTLDRIADAARDAGPAVASAYAAWFAGLWHVGEGNLPRVEELIRMLRRWEGAGQTSGSRTPPRLGTALLELVTTRDAATLRARALALDASAREGPVLTNAIATSTLNLYLMRALAETGEHAAAYAAGGRWSHFDYLLPSRMWEERGWQALATGDTAAAIRDWRMYLRTRELAEPAQRAKDDLIREELARLVGEPSGR